ncbi:MAG TPA: sigma 54-interacting transcriptional regulator [Polyangiaceae bacterium]|nr:sigma 54-interacting transcriptional regulator [Polyangiaceae bacterium]
MPEPDETYEDSQRVPRAASRPEPGVVAIFVAGQPALRALPVSESGVELGRSAPAGLLGDDERVSRRHVHVVRKEQRFVVTDLGTRNGTFVDGKRLEGSGTFTAPSLVRIGRSLLWAVEDISPFADGDAVPSLAAGPVVGGLLRRAWGEIALASKAEGTLFIRGESGSGKELAARAFHDASHHGSTSAPFVAVNCAAIPEGLSERLLFGARRGAYSGITADAEGYVQAADGGTLFLDEIAELDPLVQAKLLRVLETREVLPLGASRPQKVSIRICSASHKALRDEVSAGRFREDLYYRIGRPEVRIPPLRERIDELPAFIARELNAVDPRLTASATLVEACALRVWPGNVRELLREIRRAAHAASAEAELVVYPHHLASEAGVQVSVVVSPSDAPPAVTGASAPPATAASFTDEQIAQALEDHGGNVRGTARALGLHRNQLRRWLEKHPELKVRDDGSGN